MNRLTFDNVREALPDLDELRPVLDHVLSASVPDDTRRWSGSGELETSATRLVDPDSLSGAARTLADREHQHTVRLYELVISALSLLDQGNSVGAVKAFLEAAALEEGRNRTERAAAYAEAAYRIARDGGDSATAGLALRRRARAHRALGRLGEAERDYARAHEIAIAVSDSRGSAEAAIGAGNVLEEQGRWDEAEDWYRQALATLDQNELMTVERWHALLNLHVVLRSKGSLEESLGPLEEAETIAAALDDQDAQCFFENARGQWHMAQGDFPEAERHLRSALGVSTGAWARVIIRLNLAETLLCAHRPLEAAEEARRAEQDALLSGLPQKLPEVYRLLGRVAASEGNPDAFVLFERALEIIASRKLPALEEALTLQAYAASEASMGETASSQGLKARAEKLYRQLGIGHRRNERSDQYGSGPSDDGPEHGISDDV